MNCHNPDLPVLAAVVIALSSVPACRNLNRPAVTNGLRKMVEWAITDGQKKANALGYVPLPAVVVKRIRAEIPHIQ